MELKKYSSKRKRLYPSEECHRHSLLRLREKPAIRKESDLKRLLPNNRKTPILLYGSPCHRLRYSVVKPGRSNYDRPRKLRRNFISVSRIIQSFASHRRGYSSKIDCSRRDDNFCCDKIIHLEIVVC